jgi:hypothetical protein
VRVADKCLSHNNYNAVVHIVAPLLHSDAAKVMWAVRCCPPPPLLLP